MARLTDYYHIENFIDTFALGHYARVLGAHEKRSGQTIAFKVLRSEHLSPDGEPRWEYRAFTNEAELLTRLSDSPHIVRLLDCGYIEAQGEAPASGELVSYGQDALGFSQDARNYSAKGWRPYLALEYLPRTRSLFYLMRPDKANQRLRLPTEEGIALALQFAETLRLAHARNIVYLDHKLEHIYWDGTTLRIIDLNSSRLLNGSPKQNEGVYRQDIHNLCVGILYSLFTGLSPQKTALRPQPGSMNEIEARYQEITALDFGVEPTLSADLQALLQRGAAGQIDSADALLDSLRLIAVAHGWDFSGVYTSPANRDARSNVRAGLARLRKGEDHLREARDLFMEAAIMDGASEELQAEVRRLAKAVSEMLNYRVVP